MSISTFPLREAKAGCEIGTIVTTAERLFRFASGTSDRADPAARDALRRRTALHRAFEMSGRRMVSTSTAAEVCCAAKGMELKIRGTPAPALVNAQIQKVIHTPPEGESDLRSKPANWERCIHEAKEFDPLTRQAVMHCQFEAVHPFIDGNRRTGRALNLLCLIDKDCSTFPSSIPAGTSSGTRRAAAGICWR